MPPSNTGITVTCTSLIDVAVITEQRCATAGCIQKVLLSIYLCVLHLASFCPQLKKMCGRLSSILAEDGRTECFSGEVARIRFKLSPSHGYVLASASCMRLLAAAVGILTSVGTSTSSAGTPRFS